MFDNQLYTVFGIGLELIVSIQTKTVMNKAWHNDIFKFHVYDRKLQLVYTGRIKPESKRPQPYNLEQCSLLFNINNTGYYLKNS
jgi:hypothetical protein